MTEQEVHEQHEQDCRRIAEVNQLVDEAAEEAGRQRPWGVEEWLDFCHRRHISPWSGNVEERKHESHSLECWCAPTLYRGVVVHWDEQEAK